MPVMLTASSASLASRGSREFMPMIGKRGQRDAKSGWNSSRQGDARLSLPVK